MIKLAIVGRPNVGKSTLFNRLAGRRLAIVDDRPGVTRDRREAEGRLGDLDFILIDTAGFEDVADQTLETRMRSQTELAVREADLVLFVVDARDGITPIDRTFGEILRRSEKPVIVVANKSEGKASRAGVMEAFELGFDEPVALSAEHGEGMGDLFVAMIAKLSESQQQEEKGKRSAALNLAIIGRPNAGKSTLVNALLGEDRMITGPEAGITRDSVTIDFTWKGRPVRLVDTAGMRRKVRIEDKLEKLSVADTIHAIRFSEVCIMVMDQSEAFEKQDVQIADLVAREGRGIVYALSKWDTAENPAARYEQLAHDASASLPQTKGAPVIAFSALSGNGLDALMQAAFDVHEDWNARVKTGDLNRWLQEAMERNPPPVVDGRRVKPRYITQIKGRPPTFVLMCSRAAKLPESYKRFILNGIRDAFDMPGLPMRLLVRQSHNPYAPDQGTAPRKSAPAGRPAPKVAGTKPAPAPKPGGGKAKLGKVRPQRGQAVTRVRKRG